MSPWLLAGLAGALIALVQYGWRDLRSGGAAIPAALLRLVAIALLVALLLDAPASRAKPIASWVALDGSLSMVRGAGKDSALWRAARDSVRRVVAESVFVFGDSVRRADLASGPHDLSSSLRPIVERALGAGHPLTVFTDGELDDPEVSRSLAAGSRIMVLPRRPVPDLAVAAIDMPRAVVSGDTVEVRIGVIAGSSGAPAGTLVLTLDGKPAASTRVDALTAYGERTITVPLTLSAPAGPAVLRAAVSVAGDAESRNDTVAIAIDLSRAASAVFVSTSPDFDARYALAVLRGALGIPTRGFIRVAPGEWRVEGALTKISEAEVRQALREAPVAIMHGDTAAFGPPRSVTLGPLALIAPAASTEGEWYPSGAPTSPLSPALSGIVWDSLPPVAVSPNVPQGSWQGMEARRMRGEEKRSILVGTDSPRRIVVVPTSGLWRWRFRGGVSSDAFTALWGSIFDWLAAERADRRAAVPDERLLRAGDPVRWRRGGPLDSVAVVAIKQRGGTGRVDSLTLRFGPGATVMETPGLQPGIYDVTVRGGSAVVAVNPSREWLPRAARVQGGLVRGVATADTAPRLRSMGWAYAAAIVMLCVEWILRRRRGMR